MKQWCREDNTPETDSTIDLFINLTGNVTLGSSNGHKVFNYLFSHSIFPCFRSTHLTAVQIKKMCVQRVNLCEFCFSVQQFGKLDESERRTEEYDTLVRHYKLTHT